jgi:ribosomal protein S18 acetylase RimI-like enzyme
MDAPALRPLDEDDWRVLRELRLRALEDSPDSFAPPLASALEQPESYWRAWAKGRGRLQAFGAWAGGEPVGLISAGIRDGVGHLGALWVAPEARGRGLAVGLMNAACAWLQARGCARVELEVTEGNPASEIYRRLGFEFTGAKQPLREGSPLFEATMARERPTA